MAPPLIQLKDIKLTFGGTPLLSGVELSVSTAERVCLIGRNGSGKSTLLKIAAGLVEPDSGSRFVQPGATVRYLPQEPGAVVEGNVARRDLEQRRFARAVPAHEAQALAFSHRQFGPPSSCVLPKRISMSLRRRRGAAIRAL